MIKPTVGRVVWYYPNRPTNNEQPLAAFVTAVWSDRCVNLAYFTAEGFLHSATSVTLLQDDDAEPLNRFCVWMPYQKGQAAKHEALEKELASK